jgi:hypothetical protein
MSDTHLSRKYLVRHLSVRATGPDKDRGADLQGPKEPGLPTFYLAAGILVDMSRYSLV